LLDGQPLEDFRARSPDIADDAPVPETPGHARAGVAKAARPTASAGDEGRSLSWSKRLAAGDFEGILADADRRGIDNLLSKAPRSTSWC
jgi:hypothetical protein